MISIQNFGVFDAPPAYSDTSEFNNYSQIARTLQYRIMRYRGNEDLSPYKNNMPYYGSFVVETNKNTQEILFSGTIRNVYELKNELLIQVTEPLVNYLDFVAETVTYSTVNLVADAIKGNSYVRLSVNNAPVYSKIRFPNQAQEYLILSANQATYEIMPSLMDNYSAGTNVTLMTATIATAAQSIKKIFELAGIPDTVIGNSFDIYDSIDKGKGILFYQNLSLSDNMTVRKYLDLILELSGLRIFTRRGKLEINRVGDYYNISPTLYDGNSMYNVKQYNHFDNLLYGYYLPYRTSDNKIAFAENYISESDAAAYDNTKIFMPYASGANPNSIRIFYNSYNAASQIGELLLNYYKKPKQVIECNVKFIDPITKNTVMLYVGDGVLVSRYGQLAIWQCVAIERDMQNYTIAARFER